jgi:hypothetical protein
MCRVMFKEFNVYIGVQQRLHRSSSAMEDDLWDWIGVEDQHPLESRKEDIQEDHAESNGDDVEEDHGAEGPEIYIEEYDLVDHVEALLNRGDHLSSIATSLGLSRKVLSRRLYNLGWEGVYHNLTPEEYRDAILSMVPFDRGRCNWGIRHAQSLLRRELKLRVPRQLIQDVLHAMQPGHMRRREVRLLFRGQYDVMEPMALWHMDYEFP